MMNRMLSRGTALLLALVLALLPMAAFCESEEEAEEELAELESLPATEEDAMNEEDSSNIYQPNPGDYEWYMLPVDLDEDHAYVDIYPVEEEVTASNGVWNISFVMEECNSFDFKVSSVILICFTGDVEVSREVLSEEEFTDLLSGNFIPADSATTCSFSLTDEGQTACAISLVGTDATDEELEFHSIVFLTR